MTAPPDRYDHVVWIVMENHSYEQIIGASDAPYINSSPPSTGWRRASTPKRTRACPTTSR